jgi:hypothetical protein
MMKKGMMISCKDATELVIRKSHMELTRRDRFRLWFHLVMCKFCSLFEKQNKMIDELAAASDETAGEGMPAESREKMLRELLKE